MNLPTERKFLVILGMYKTEEMLLLASKCMVPLPTIDKQAPLAVETLEVDGVA
jgi:hypothetical protein